MELRNKYKDGLKDGIPIALGYLSVSFAFGLSAVNGGLFWWQAVVISMTNLTSAGQVAGLSLMLSFATLAEMAATQLVINLRYALMSLSLSQKLDASVTRLERFVIAFFNTDEIFAVAASGGDVTTKYMLGLGTLPYFGWATGTLLGAAAGSVLPAAITSALGIAIFGMFIAIIVPVAKRSRAVLIVILISITISVLIRCFLPFVSSGFSIIICALAASLVGALVFPIKEETV